VQNGKSYLSHAGKLECVAPAGGVIWATAQKGGSAQFSKFLKVFVLFFAAFFTGLDFVGFNRFFWQIL
jgi:hypothetical protein